VRACYHLPSAVTVDDDLAPAERQRLTAVVLDAVARAVHAAAPADHATVATQDRPPAREVFAQRRMAGDSYATPSYDSGGRPVKVPLRPSFPFRVRLDRRLDSDELLREFVRQYRNAAGAAQADRLLGTEHWRWTGTPPEVTAADVARGYKVLTVTDHSLHLADAGRRAADDQAVAALDAVRRDALNAEADRRFRAATGRTGRLDDSAEDRELAAYWLAVRDDLLRERREIDALPARIRDFLFTAGETRVAGPADYAVILRLASKLALLSDAELAGYKAKVTTRTTDWAEFEASVDRHLAEVARSAAAGATVEHARTALYGMDRLYALYKAWQAPRSPAAARFGVHDPAKDRVDIEFHAELAAQRLASPAAFEALIAAYLSAFEHRTVLIGLDLLARYDSLLVVEQQRFQAPGFADRLLAALGGTQARTLYAEAEDKADAARGIGPDPELHRYLREEYLRKVRLEGEASQAKAAADKLVTAVATGPLVAEEGFDRAALARATTVAEVLRVVQDYVKAHRDGIAATRARLDGDQTFVYALPPLLAASLKQQDIQPGTIYHEIITDKLDSLRARKIVTGILLAVVAIAISVATAGTGTPAALGALAVFGLGAWQAIEAYRDYTREHAAHEAGLLDEDPWFGWVVVAAVGAGIDLAGLAAAVRPAEAALTTFKATGDLAELGAGLRAAGIEQRLAAGILTEARGALGLNRAFQALARAAGRLNMAIGGVEALGAMVRAMYYAARQGIVSLERFVTRLRAARLIAEGELDAEQLIRLRAAFEEAGAANSRLRTLAGELGLTDEQLGAVVESWGANPTWRLADVEQELRAVAAGNTRATFRSVLAARPVLEGELSTLEQALAATGRLDPARMERLAARLSRLRQIDAISTAPRDARIVEVSLDASAPNFYRRVAPTVPDPPVVLEFPDGSRVWRATPGGPLEHEATLGRSLGRADTERAMYSAGEHGNLPAGPKYQRAHTAGQGTGFESPYGILYAPEFVNQTLQNDGIETFLRGVVSGARTDETFRVLATTRPHPGTLRLATIDYTLVLVNRTGGVEEIASYSIAVSRSAEHPVVTATSLRFAPTATARSVATRFPIPPQLTRPARHAY